MGRHPRVHSPKLLYHIMSRGNNGQAIYKSTKDYNKFIASLGEAKQKFRFKIYAYCLMSNHFHLLIEVNEKSTSQIMQSILTRHSKYFNRTHSRKGHLFQGRYKAIICDRDVYLMQLVRYIHLNPVRAGLTQNMSEWQWSGHGEYSGKSERLLIDNGIVSEMFGKGEKGYKKYKLFLEESIGKKYTEEFHPKESNPFLGSEAFKEQNSKVERIIKNKEKINLEEILNAEAQKGGVKREMIREKLRWKKLVKARVGFIKRAVLGCGYSQKEVAQYLNCDPSYITRVLQKSQ